MKEYSGDAGPASFRFSPRPNRAHEINWRPWSEEVFREAQREDKPILLAISAFWCHWCHVMDETSYSDPAVIETINRDFVPVRVDTDQRPDVNRRYNQGGWPTVAILAPTGDLLTGATYVPPAQLLSFLAQVREYYLSHKGEIVTKLEELKANRIKLMEEIHQPDGHLTDAVVEEVSQTLLSNYDPAYGGFGRQPKFPHTDALELALELYHRTGDDVWGGMVKKTLDSMASGGLFDQVEGGFFRYSTMRDWSIPHYEKMLEDNVPLLRICLRAYQVTGIEQYMQTAQGVLEYLDANLYDPSTGAFFGSQDADEEYYHFGREERSIMVRPAVDKIIYTDRAALAASAYIEAYKVLWDERYLDTALGALEFLWNRMRDDKAGMYHYWDGQAHLTGLLEDQVAVAQASLDAYEVTAESRYLDQALALGELLQREFYDSKLGGFFDRAGGLEAPGSFTTKELAHNAEAATLFLRLYRLTDKEEYRKLAEGCLKAFLGLYKNYGIIAAGYARAVDFYINDPIHIRIVGDRSHLRTIGLLKESLQVYAPGKVVQVLDPVRDGQRVVESVFQPLDGPVAYVCLGRVCLAPVEDAKEIRDAIRRSKK